MRTSVAIGLIGDYSESVPAHRAIPIALRDAAKASAISVEPEWIPTEQVTSRAHLSRFNGLWCVPASPYRSMEGALLAIRHAREQAIPFLGTCGGFQHAIVEYARNVLGWVDADSAETAPDSSRAVIAPLECALVEATRSVRLFPGSRIASAYGAAETTEEYRCRYGLNPAFRAELVAGPLRAAADDETGEVRAVELDGHPFFVATLFQPERAALKGEATPLVSAFVAACAS
jgi:CTP synthase (UTP-ammonia lyase)